jgi:hypothetical protein
MHTAREQIDIVTKQECRARRRLSMFSPFKKNTRYFIKTITFYYIATYKSQRGGFFKFENVVWIENVPDWEDFWKSKPALPPSIKEHQMSDLSMNGAAIIDFAVWQ